MTCFRTGRWPFGTPLIAWLVLCLGAAWASAGEAIRITHDGQLKFAPVFTSGGREVVYAAHESANLVSLQRLPLAGGDHERLHPTVVAHQFDPAFTADGRWHCYSMSSGSPQLVLVIEDAENRKSVEFRPRDARATARNPSFSPDGLRIAFGLSDAQGHQIATVNRQGEDLQLLTRSAGSNCWPAFSPDGQQIAFGSSREGDFEIYVMRADGSEPRRLTQSPGRDMRPAWSPDGKRIAFVSVRDGNSEIYVMDADGANPRNISQHPDRDDYPAWHPDGNRLVIVATRDGQSDLYLVSVDAIRD